MSNMAFASNIQAGPQPYMGVSNTFSKLSRVHYGMDTIGLKSGRVQTQDPGGIGVSGCHY